MNEARTVLPHETKSNKPDSSELPAEFKEVSERIKLLEDGLPTDWLVRAHRVRNIDTMVYLSDLQEKWGKRNLKQIAFILQEHERNGYGLIPEFDPPKIMKTRKNEETQKDPTEVADFVTRLMALIKQETVIWDKFGDPFCGCHQKMRQAWSNISLKLGGWASIQHVHMLKSIYRRKRDMYNTDYLRENKPFQYAEQMEFLKEVVEVGRSSSETTSVGIGAYMKTFYPELNFNVEIEGAPDDTKSLLRSCESMIEKVGKLYGSEALAEFLTNSCNETIRLKEEMAVSGLRDDEWVQPINYIEKNDADNSIIENTTFEYNVDQTDNETTSEQSII